MLKIFKKERAAFGLDISDLSIKLVQFEKISKGLKAIGFSDHSMPKGIMVNDSVVDENAMAAQIKSALNKLDFGKVNTNLIISSIPESKAFVRIIQIPKMSEEQAASAVPIEAEQYIPVPLDQTYLDWQILRTGEDKMDVLVTAAPKDFIDSYLKVLKMAGLRPVAFEVESAAIVRALVTPAQKEQDIMIVDMNTYRSSLIIVSGGYPQFSSSVPVAGDAFTQSIAKALSISPEEAEKVKRSVGMDGEPGNSQNANIRAALVPVVDNLVDEIKNVLKFHDENSAKPVTQILLSGGTAKLLHLSDYFHEKLAEYPDIQIAMGNPWVNIFNGKNGNPPLPAADSISYTTAIGLALRGVDLG